MATDPRQQVLTLLSTNWNKSNTSSITPEFEDILDYKTWNFNNGHVVFAQVPIELTEAAGISSAAKNNFFEFNLDIRVYGATGIDNHDLYLEFLKEIERIFDLNINFPFGANDFTELRYDGTQRRDLSDKQKGMFRKIFPVKLAHYCKLRG